MYDIIIIGSGPSGLFASANIKNKKILLLEKNEILGKKLLVSGSGQCNLTHSGDIKDFFNHYGQKKNYVKKILLRFSNVDLIKYFNQRGLDFIVDENGKYFPKSLKSKDLMNVLIDEIYNNNVEIMLSKKVTKISKEKDFSVYCGEKKYIAKNVVIATGGKSYPVLGTTGDGYEFAETLGHKIISTKPSLTSLNIENFNYKELAGTSFKNAKISISNKLSNIGDLLITHKGFSGPCVLDFSRYIYDGDIIYISFLNLIKEKFSNILYNKLLENPKKDIFNILKDFDFTKKFLYFILNELKINYKELACNLNKKDRNAIVDYFIEKPFKVSTVNGFDSAMVTSGGIDTFEIDSKTMQSKLVEGLFFCGEIIDVDGDTGGYNIQFAFSTAKIISDFFNGGENN
jgi:hypothetical protein